MIGHRALLACVALGLSAALVACGGGKGDSPSPTASPSLTLTDWAQQVCALAVDAAATLDTPTPADPATMTLDERKQRAADVLAPSAERLDAIAQAAAKIEPPPAATEFHQVLHSTMAAIAAAWLDLVDKAAAAETADELDAANAVFIQAQDTADAQVVAAFESLDAEVTAALSQPADCGVLNNVRS